MGLTIDTPNLLVIGFNGYLTYLKNNISCMNFPKLCETTVILEEMASLSSAFHTNGIIF